MEYRNNYNELLTFKYYNEKLMKTFIKKYVL